jgi:hypothetical protein
MDRHFEISIELDCNVKEATEIMHEVVRLLASYNHLTKVGNFTMRGSDYVTLFVMYANDKLVTALKNHNNPPQAEPEDYPESEVRCRQLKMR